MRFVLPLRTLRGRNRGGDTSKLLRPFDQHFCPFVFLSIQSGTAQHIAGIERIQGGIETQIGCARAETARLIAPVLGGFKARSKSINPRLLPKTVR